MIPTELQDIIRRLVSRLMMPLVRWHVTPNTITVIGLLLNGLTGLALGMGHFIIGGSLVLFSGAFDMLDGGLARARGGGTTFGAFFDSTIDRLSEGLIYLGLIFWYAQQDRTGEELVVYLVILGSMLISYTRARAEGLGLECKVGLLARPERVILLGGALILDGLRISPLAPGRLLMLVLACLAVLTFFTFGQRLYHIWRLTLPPQASTERGPIALYVERWHQRRARHS